MLPPTGSHARMRPYGTEAAISPNKPYLISIQCIARTSAALVAPGTLSDVSEHRQNFPDSAARMAPISVILMRECQCQMHSRQYHRLL